MKYLTELNDVFWVSVLTNQNYEKEVIKLFYSHKFSLVSLTEGMSLEYLTEQQICDIILKTLAKKTCSEILDIISEEFVPFEIKKADICQFSSFEDSYYKVVNLIIRSGLQGVSWERMGFLLRSEPRTKVADTKYGENHGKTAVQLGLCYQDSHHNFWTTCFGRCFNDLSDVEKESLKAKLCLYIPIIQNYFVQGMNEDLLSSYFNILTESTQKRRKPNVIKLITIVKSSL